MGVGGSRYNILIQLFISRTPISRLSVLIVAVLVDRVYLCREGSIAISIMDMLEVYDIPVRK